MQHIVQKTRYPLLLGLLLMLLACTMTQPLATITTDTPSWACPSPTPLPFGASGPIKQVIREPLPTTVPTGPIRYREEPIYYEQWEQEYADLGGSPFPSPTPYVVVGTTYTLGQRVHLPPIYALVSAQAGALQPDGRQLYLIDITWENPQTVDVPINYLVRVALRAITTPDGRVQTSDAWQVSRESLAAAPLDIPDRIPPGTSTVRVPILAPPGVPHTVDIGMVRDADYAPVLDLTPTPTATPVGLAPTPNTDLRAPRLDLVVVQFVAARPIDPPCDAPGAMTDRATAGSGVNGVAERPITPPAGSARVVEVALAQVGKRYVWGATGPNAFDCSGLMVWAYAQVGLRVPVRTSAEQYARMTPASAAAIQPGDLAFFIPRGGSRVTHVGMVVGDLNGDGKWDWVHAASPRLGVRVEYDLFGSSFYGNANTCELCLVGFRTMR